MSEKNIEDYWNKKIIDWEKSSYQKDTKGLSLIEKMATRFRSSIGTRMFLSLDLLRPFVANRIILDLGCGSGIFCFKLLENGAREVIGIDFSRKAISVAERRNQELNLAGRCRFIVVDVRKISLPQADITTGLGLLDYLCKEEILAVFKRLTSRLFLFTFSEKTYSWAAFLHKVYLKSQRCPVAHQYRIDEISQMLNQAGYGKLSFVKDRRMLHGVIVHNLKTAE